jgi:putative intracellular protease/amidase
MQRIASTEQGTVSLAKKSCWTLCTMKIKVLSFIFLSLVCFSALVFGQQRSPNAPPPPATKLVPPATGKIRVAFVISPGTESIDFTGPWAVFERVLDFSRGKTMGDAQPFQLYTVSDSTNPIHVSGGMQIIPDFTFADAPQPNVVVVPGTSETPGMLDWIRKQAKRSDVVMSVCVGGYLLAKAGVLDGKKAASVGGYIDIQKKYPDVQYLFNRRFVQSDPVIFTSGPLGAGIDLAIHVVELYFGRDVAARAANGLNYYGGEDWAGDGTDSHKAPLPSDRISTGVSGNWQGEATTKDGALQLAVHLWPYQNGKQLVGFAEILNRDTGTLFIDPITFNEPDLHFEIHMVSGTFDGKLDAQGKVIEGNWKQPRTSAPLVLKRVEK